MTIILYDAEPSANSERVRILLEEKRLVYSRRTLVLKSGEQKQPEFLKLNPYGRVPVLIDDGRVLFESCIINEYLEERYPEPSMAPKDAYAKSRGRMLLDYALNFTQEAYWNLREQFRRESVDRDSTLIGELQRSLSEQIVYLEEALGEKKFFLDDITLVDIGVWPRLSRLQTYGVIDDLRFSGLARWLREMAKRPSVQLFIESSKTEGSRVATSGNLQMGAFCN